MRNIINKLNIKRNNANISGNSTIIWKSTVNAINNFHVSLRQYEGKQNKITTFINSKCSRQERKFKLKFQKSTRGVKK